MRKKKMVSRKVSRAWRRDRIALAGLVLLAAPILSLDIRDSFARLSSGVLQTPSGQVYFGRVSRVIDGDTFIMEGPEARIRVWGLDAPELSDPRGDAATQALRVLIADRPVRCVQRDQDNYGRIVAQCDIHDGRDMTRAMIESGTAQEYCRFSNNHYGTCTGRR